jgi:hypothetical protein
MPTPMPTPMPVSNICFPAGTPIQTDQGIVSIELLDTAKHTIARQPIIFVTKTTTLDKYLILFKKDALGVNTPSKDTIMTKNHQIMFKGVLSPAHRFLTISKDIAKVAYAGEVLYNVLLDKYTTMKVNNLVCETLHPDNDIAKLYRSTSAKTPNQKSLHH